MEYLFAFVGLLLTAAVGYFVVGVVDRRTRFDPKSVRGKRVLITGASQGVGRELACQYSRLGARILLTARREKELKEVVAKCRKLGAEKVEYLLVDFAKPEDRVRTIEQTEILLGGLDHLILNHIRYGFGIWTGSDKNVADLESDLNVNFISKAELALKLIDLMKASRGSIGVVSSLGAKFPFPKGGTHAVSKAALRGFFGTLYHDLRLGNSGVSVTQCIMGPIATIYDRKRFSYFGMSAAAVDQAAMAIIEGVSTRAREIYHPQSVTLALFLHRFFPTWVENYTFASYDALLELYASLQKK